MLKFVSYLQMQASAVVCWLCWNAFNFWTFHSLAVSLLTARLNIQKFYMVLALCWIVVWIWEQTAVIFLYVINWVVCITVVKCLQRGTGRLVIQSWLHLVLKRLNEIQSLTAWKSYIVCFQRPWHCGWWLSSIMFRPSWPSVRPSTWNNSVSTERILWNFV
jgi:hypothetical protein